MPLQNPRCRMCNHRFDQKAEHQKFCSDDCRRAYHQNGPAIARIQDFVDKRLLEAEARLIAAWDAAAAEGRPIAEAYLDLHPHRRRLVAASLKIKTGRAKRS